MTPNMILLIGTALIILTVKLIQRNQKIEELKTEIKRLNAWIDNHA